jgi:Flp pilus assembly protein TadG
MKRVSNHECLGSFQRRVGTSVNETGQSLAELALLLPIFLVLLLGAAEFGRLTYIGIEVSNAARAGVQYGAQSRATASDASGMQTAATNDGPDVSGLSATATHFCSCSNGTASTCAATDCSGSRIIEFVQVNTSAAVAPMFTYPGLPGTLTLTGKAVMRVAQ